MPITHPGSVEYILIFFSVDMDAMSAVAKFKVVVDGTKVGEVEIGVPSATLGPMLAGTADAGKSRAADITDLIYQHAISTEVLPGTIV
jgi:hypothetical protein